MPSPVGHVLGGIAAGVLASRNASWSWLLWFALAGAAADLDLVLPMPHRGPSHSLGAALVILVGTLAWQRVARGEASDTGSARLALGLGVSCASHVLLDWLGSDTFAPRGVMALWPFSQTYYISGLDLFDRIERRYWLSGFWWSNAMAVAREVVIVGPVAWLVLRRHRRTRRARSGTDAS